MPLSSNTISTLIQSFMKIPLFTGKMDKNLADAIAIGLFTYLKTPNLVNFQLNGTAGPVGTVTSITIAGVVSNTMSVLMKKSRFTGKNWKDLTDAISKGVAAAIQIAMVNGTASGCAVGVGTGRFLQMNASALSSRIKATAAFKSIRGSKKDQMVDAIAFGICTHLKSTPTVTVSIAGAIAPVPPAGPVAVTAIPTIYNTII